MENFKENIADNFSHIPGWGIDADPENEPTYPMKHYTGDDHNRLNYERAVQQRSDVEILHSNERPGLTTVFGSPCPPSGLSGRLRRYAFRYSEGSYGHWIPLILADRVNVIEGIIDDIRQGHFPNIIVEKGWTGEWKYNRKNLVKNLAITAFVTGLLFTYLSRKKSSKA